MTSDRLARDYLARARVRRQTMAVLMTAGSYPDVVRTSHDVVELVLKGALRFDGPLPLLTGSWGSTHDCWARVSHE